MVKENLRNKNIRRIFAKSSLCLVSSCPCPFWWVGGIVCEFLRSLIIMQTIDVIVIFNGKVYRGSSVCSEEQVPRRRRLKGTQSMTVVLRKEASSVVVGGIRYNICSPAVRIPCITMRSSSLLNLGKQQEHSLKKILLGKFFFESRLLWLLLLLLPCHCLYIPRTR